MEIKYHSTLAFWIASRASVKEIESSASVTSLEDDILLMSDAITRNCLKVTCKVSIFEKKKNCISTWTIFSSVRPIYKENLLFLYVRVAIFLPKILSKIINQTRVIILEGHDEAVSGRNKKNSSLIVG
jgi:hypothetical protein